MSFFSYAAVMYAMDIALIVSSLLLSAVVSAVKRRGLQVTPVPRKLQVVSPYMHMYTTSKQYQQNQCNWFVCILSTSLFSTCRVYRNRQKPADGQNALLARQIARDLLHGLSHRHKNTWQGICWPSRWHWLEQQCNWVELVENQKKTHKYQRSKYSLLFCQIWWWYLK